MTSAPTISRTRLRLLLATMFAVLLAAAGCSGREQSILKVGDTWTTTVKQNADVSAPSRDTSTSKQVYRFKVVSAPSNTRNSWKIRATIDDVEGPFAAGFELFYTERGNALVLTSVAVTGTKPLDAAAAPVVLGQGFPLDKRITRRPASRTISAPRGGAGDAAATPPSFSHDGKGGGAATETGGNIPADSTDAMPPGKPPTSPPG